MLSVSWLRCLLDRASLWYLENKKPTRCHLLFYYTSYMLNMFRALLCPPLGARDCAIELPHWSFLSWFVICWRLGAVRLEWCSGCRPACWAYKKYKKWQVASSWFFILQISWLSKKLLASQGRLWYMFLISCKNLKFMS